MDKLLKYLNALGKDDRHRFILACRTSENYLRKATSQKQLLNAATCVLIEHESGGQVTRKDLRPDDWQSIWPELADGYCCKSKDKPAS